MYFKQLLNDRHGCASYVIASQKGDAAIVDPAIETGQYDELIAGRKLTLRYVIDTHVHADHVSGARRLVATRGGELCMHEKSPAAYPFLPLKDGQELELGELRLRVVHTPGHRGELISILIINTLRSPEPSMVLTGDSLLVGDVGRPDFGGGDAAAQYESVSRLLRLPDWVAVFPGHFEGPCGKGMCGRPSTTIGFERLFNPLAKLDRSAFIDYLTKEVPPRPLNMSAIEATNRGSAEMDWAMLTQSSQIVEIEPGEVSKRPEGSVLVDVREPVEYAHGHIPGAINLPQADLATRLNELPRDKQIIVVCKAGMRAMRAAQFLLQRGYTNVTSIRGGTDGWKNAGMSVMSEPDAPKPQIKESEWAHAGGYEYEI